MKRHDSWMPLYTGDYLRSTLHLTTTLHGAYLLLIMRYWDSGEPLPDDDTELAAVAKVSPSEWKRMRSTLAKFFVIIDGKWVHRRIEEELRTADKKYKTRLAASKLGNEKRWGKNRKSDPNGTPNAIPMRSQPHIGNAVAPYAERHSLPESKDLQGLERWQGDNQGANPANDTPSEGQPEWRVIGDEDANPSSATVIPLRRAVGDK